MDAADLVELYPRSSWPSSAVSPISPLTSSWVDDPAAFAAAVSTFLD